MVQLKWQLIFCSFLFYLCNSSRATKRIVNGFNAVPKQFPYQVFIEARFNCEFKPFCGGVVISNRIVLTAAHCIDSKMEAVRIYFGTVDFSNKMEMGQQRLIVKQKNIVVHPDFDKDQLINDIALIKLPAEIRFDDFIQPAKLPDPDQLYENESGVVSGWGRTSANGELTEQLLYYNVTVFSNEECKNTINPQFFPLSYICLKPSQSSPCNGDSGGPLAIRNDDGSHTLLGLTSFGAPGCPINSYAVYVRVSSFLKWIKQNE